MKKLLDALTLKRVILGLVFLFVLIQLFRIDKTNPEFDPSQDFIAVTNPPQEIATMLKAACYDCHSNETKYPWYSNVAPVSWWVKDHINEGRKELNFSLWGTFTEKRINHKLEEGYEKVGEGEMPLKSYLIIHDEARLTDGQRKQLADWLNSLRPAETKSESEGEGEGGQH